MLTFNMQISLSVSVAFWSIKNVEMLILDIDVFKMNGYTYPHPQTDIKMPRWAPK